MDDHNSFTYLADYDDLTSLKNDEKIDWVRKRINKVFLKPVNRFKISNNTDLALGVMTLICCAIEALGHFRNGRTDKNRVKGQDEKDFKLFIKEYMPEASRIGRYLYYYFRCGLAHAFVIERGSIEGEIKSLYEREKRKRVFYRVNPWKLFDLLEKAIENYFNNLGQKGRKRLRKNFRNRFEYSYKFWLENRPN